MESQLTHSPLFALHNNGDGKAEEEGRGKGQGKADWVVSRGDGGKMWLQTVGLW